MSVLCVVPVSCVKRLVTSLCSQCPECIYVHALVAGHTKHDKCPPWASLLEVGCLMGIVELGTRQTRAMSMLYII